MSDAEVDYQFTAETPDDRGREVVFLNDWGREGWYVVVPSGEFFLKEIAGPFQDVDDANAWLEQNP